MRFASAVHSPACAGGARNRTTVVNAFSARQASLRCCGWFGSKRATSDYSFVDRSLPAGHAHTSCGPLANRRIWVND